MNIWEERYCDEKWGLETPSSFNYFCQYLQQTYPRSIKELHHQLTNEKANNNSNKRVPTYKTLREYAAKWKWTKRADQYDEYLKQLHFKTKEKEVMEWETEQLKLAKERAKLHSDTLNQIHKADEDLFPLTKKAYAEETNERAYNESIDAVYKLMHGGIIKSENRNTNKDTVKQETTIIETKTIEEKNKENDEYFKQLENDMGTE